MALGRSRPELTPGQRNVLSNSTNLAMLIFLLERPATLNEVAEAHQLIPLEANVRLRQLVREGLVSTRFREGPGATTERVYQAAIDDFELVTQASGNVTANDRQLQLILNQMRRDLTYLALHPQEGPIHVRTIGVRLAPAAFEKWLQRVRELEHEFDQADDTGQTTWYFLTVAMYQRPQRAEREGLPG
jgi:hypothetical protein